MVYWWVFDKNALNGISQYFKSSRGQGFVHKKQQTTEQIIVWDLVLIYARCQGESHFQFLNHKKLWKLYTVPWNAIPSDIVKVHSPFQNFQVQLIINWAQCMVYLISIAISLRVNI